MKQIIKATFFVAAALALFACNKQELPSEGTVKTVQFSTTPVTKTVFGTPVENSVPTLWTANKTVGISLNLAAMKQSTEPVVGNDGATASFSADIEDSGSSPYTFYAVSPFSSVISVSDSYYSAQVDIPASQTPLATSVDENAQILVAKHNAGETFPTSSVLMNFGHLTAYGKLSFANLSLASDEEIESVSLTAAENWVGRYYYYFEDHEPNSAGDLVANSAGKTLTLTTSSATNIWFACAPVDLGGKNVKVVITTDKATTYTKNITIPAGKTFAAGKVNAFTIDMNGITAEGAEEYHLVTNPTELTVGSKVIIAAPGATASAISTTQNSNNRAETSVTKEQNNTVIVSPSDAVQIFTIESGTTSESIAFNTGSGYIYAASSSGNQMKTEGTLSANSSWSVSIDSEGVATITALGTNTRNVIRYNGSNNPPIYSCYGSTATTGSLVSVYKLGVPDTRDESAIVANTEEELFVGQTKGIEFDVEPAGATVTLALGTGAEGYVSVSGFNVTGVAATSGVPVVLSFAGDDDYKPTSENVNVIVYAVPEIVSFGQTQNGFTATINEKLDGFTYSWVLYHGSVAPANIVSNSNRTTNSTTISATFADDLSISEFEVDDDYLLVVTATKGELSANSASASFTAIDLNNVTEGATWSYTFEASQWSSAGDATLDGKTWTMAGTGDGYWGYDATKGQQFGSGSKPYSALTLTSNFGASYGVREIRVSTSGASSINATVSVSVGGTALECSGSTTATLTAANTVYTFVTPDGNLKAGDIVISYANSSFKAIYIKKIVVNPAAATQLTMSDITCTAHTSSSLTFGWSAVADAVGYQVSTDGSTFGDTQTGLSYSLTGLDSETDYYIWVKAIGDGVNALTSESKKSAVGTTDAASGERPTNGDELFSTDFGSSAVALSAFTGGTSYNNASTITYTASNVDNVKIDTGSAGNMTSGNLFIGGKNGGAGLTATIAGIKTYGATSVTVSWAANNAYSEVSIIESSTTAKTSANSNSNSATFTLSGSETTISLVFTGIGKNNTRVDNVRVIYGQ